MYIYHYPANQNLILFSISSTKQEIIQILYHMEVLFSEQELHHSSYTDEEGKLL